LKRKIAKWLKVLAIIFFPITVIVVFLGILIIDVGGLVGDTIDEWADR